jgi:hypothetical protein
MKVRPYVKISKISASDDPKYPTPSCEDYEGLKEVASLSLPVAYWVEGYLSQGPEIGKSVVVEREVRNGIKAMGTFLTSPVVKVTPEGFETLNSVYKLEVLK